MARFKELCLDTAADGARIADFWAALSGGRAESSTSTTAPDVLGAHEHEGIAVCPVPEAKTVKNRVHLDVYARGVDDVVALGASVVLPAAESGFGWTVVRDPEGNELCVFEREALPAWRVHGMGIDSVDAQAQAAWWAAAYDVPVRTWPGEDHLTLEHVTPDATFTWDFAPVPEPKTVKNRLHWDVYGTPEEFLDRGATLLADLPRWTVLADPEGNEFCVFPEPAGLA